MNNSKITEKSIVADQTTPVTVNLDKLNNITEMETIIEDIDTESKYGIVRTIKLSKPGMDIFDGDFKTEDWKYYDFSLYFYNEYNNEIGELTLYSCYDGTDYYQYLSSGEGFPFYSSIINLFPPLNEGTKFYIKAQFRINFDEHYSIGYLYFDSKKSDFYTWNTIVGIQ